MAEQVCILAQVHHLTVVALACLGTHGHASYHYHSFCLLHACSHLAEIPLASASNPMDQATVSGIAPLTHFFWCIPDSLSFSRLILIQSNKFIPSPATAILLADNHNKLSRSVTPMLPSMIDGPSHHTPLERPRSWRGSKRRRGNTRGEGGKTPREPPHFGPMGRPWSLIAELVDSGELGGDLDIHLGSSPALFSLVPHRHHPNLVSS